MSYYLNVKVNLQQLVMSKVCKEERERERERESYIRATMCVINVMSKFVRSGHRQMSTDSFGLQCV